MSAESELRPYQRDDLKFFQENPRSGNWSDAGTGKTRVMLLAADTSDILVVAPAAIRDTKVWPKEAERLDEPAPLVVSYHAVARAGPADIADLARSIVIMDESQHAKERKVSWSPNLLYLSKQAERVHQATGTPMPNGPDEIWGQFHILFPEDKRFKAYWPWIMEWFVVQPNRFNPRARDVLGLLGCRHQGDEAEHCEHWQAFHDANIEGRVVRHLFDDVLADLPPLSGAEHPLDTPMTTLQARVYKGLKKELLALIPDEGIAIEALTQASQFQMLQQLSTGLSVIDPDADPKDKESGKFAILTGLFEGRNRPQMVTVWYRNSAKAVVRICERMGLTYVAVGGKTTRRQRDIAVTEFSKGGIDVFIGSVGVVKEGIDGLQHAANEIILLERSWRPGDNTQTIRRLQRMGQEHPIIARQLLTPKSADSYQWDQIHSKSRNIHLALRRSEIASLI